MECLSSVWTCIEFWNRLATFAEPGSIALSFLTLADLHVASVTSAGGRSFCLPILKIERRQRFEDSELLYLLDLQLPTWAEVEAQLFEEEEQVRLVQYEQDFLDRTGRHPYWWPSDLGSDSD